MRRPHAESGRHFEQAAARHLPSRPMTEARSITRDGARRLVVRGPFHGTSGHDHHVRELVRHLAGAGVRVQLLDLPEWGSPALPTESSRQAWRAAGIADERLRLCPLGVDAQRFRPGLAPLALVDRAGKPVAAYATRVLNVSELNPRKNLLGLLRVWIRATRDDDDAILIVKLTRRSTASVIRFIRDVDRFERETGHSRRRAAPILFDSCAGHAGDVRGRRRAGHPVPGRRRVGSGRGGGRPAPPRGHRGGGPDAAAGARARRLALHVGERDAPAPRGPRRGPMNGGGPVLPPTAQRGPRARARRCDAR